MSSIQFKEFDVSRSASTYGSGTYGTGTYGAQLTDPLSNVEYYLRPSDGRSREPNGVGWEYRIGDTVRFEAELVGYEGDQPLDVLASAVLVLECLDPGSTEHRVLDLQVSIGGSGEKDRFLYSPLLPAGTGNEIGFVPGLYRVTVIATSVGGRKVSYDAEDKAKLLVRGVE
jgi:hypothetical protein